MRIAQIVRDGNTLAVEDNKYNGFETYVSAATINGRLYVSSTNNVGNVYEFDLSQAWPLFDSASSFVVDPAYTVEDIKFLQNKIIYKVTDHNNSIERMFRADLDWTNPEQIYQATNINLGVS